MIWTWIYQHHQLPSTFSQAMTFWAELSNLTPDSIHRFKWTPEPMWTNGVAYQPHKAACNTPTRMECRCKNILLRYTNQSLIVSAVLHTLDLCLMRKHCPLKFWGPTPAHPRNDFTVRSISLFCSPAGCRLDSHSLFYVVKRGRAPSHFQA